MYRCIKLEIDINVKFVSLARVYGRIHALFSQKKVLGNCFSWAEKDDVVVYYDDALPWQR